MNIRQFATRLTVIAGLGFGCGKPPLSEKETQFCKPSPALLEGDLKPAVSKCFSLFRFYPEQLVCSEKTLPTPAKLGSSKAIEPYLDYLDCLWVDKKNPSEGLKLFNEQILAKLPPSRPTTDDKEIFVKWSKLETSNKENPSKILQYGAIKDISETLQERVFQKYPELLLESRLATRRTDKIPHPEPIAEDIPPGKDFTYRDYIYFRENEESQALRWLPKAKKKEIQYWDPKKKRWIKMGAVCESLMARCNSLNTAGSDETDTKVFNLGATAGVFHLVYNTVNIPDVITVSCDGKELWSSGCIGTYGKMTVKIPFSCESGQAAVRVDPNCLGTINTAWDYRVICPGGTVPTTRRPIDYDPIFFLP